MSWIRDICHVVANWCVKHDRYLAITGREEASDIYLERYYVLFPRSWERKLPFNLYLHRFHRSDRDVPHDHPWHWASLILTGGYTEFRPTPFGSCSVMRAPGDLVFRKATDPHLVILNESRSRVLGYTKPKETYEVWTLFGVGRRFRDWGFHTKKGWVDWRTHLNVPASQSEV